MLLHNLSKIERITERETRTSRFIPQLRRRTHGKRSAVNSDTYSGESVLVSGTNSHCTTTNTSTPTITITSTNTNTTITNTSSTTTTTFIRTTANHNQRRLQRKAVQSICDFGLILPAAVHFQSLDYAKVSASSTTSTSSSSTLHSSSKTSTTSKLLSSAMSSSSAATSGSSGSSSNNTAKAASTTTTKKRSTGGFLSGSRNAQARKASLDEKDSGSIDSAGSVGKHHHHEQQQRSSVDISILLTDDDSSSRLSDTGK